MKKIAALVLALAMVLSLCSFAAAEDPIVVTFWHNRSSGANYEALQTAVNMFNESVGAEKGIVLEEVYTGGYVDLYSKTQLATQSGEQPAIAVAGNTYVVAMIDDGLLVDMAPYAEKTGFDMTNIIDGFMTVAGNTDGQLYSLPYVRSTPLFYYNKTMAAAAGIEVPEELTVDKMVEICKAMYKVSANGEVETYGLEIFNDTGYYNAAFLWQLGEPMLSVEGDTENRTSPALDGTSMLKIMTDWNNWVKEGWCRPFDSTNASTVALEMMYQGKLFSLLNSSGGLKNAIKAMNEAGYELGIAQFPTYDINNKAVEAGGGQIVMIAGNDPKVEAAAWEVMQFLMSDEQVYLNAVGTGYLPVTKSVATYDKMVAFWAENPLYKIPFDQLLDHAYPQEYPAFTALQEFIVNWQEQVSLMIQEGSITPEEAVEAIKTNTAHLF